MTRNSQVMRTLAARATIALALLASPMLALATGTASAETTQALKQLATPGVVIERVEMLDGDGKVLQIGGRAGRNAEVSDFLRVLDGAADFEKPDLLQIQLDREGHPQFEIRVQRRAAPAPAPAPPAAVERSRKPGYRCRSDGREVFQAQPCPPTK